MGVPLPPRKLLVFKHLRVASGHEKTAQVKEKLARIENYFLDIYSAIMPKKTAASAKIKIIKDFACFYLLG